MSNEFFPPRPDARPTIYAYEDTNPQYAGLLKVGYTTVDTQSRVAQQYSTKKPGKPPYRIVLEESAMRNDGTSFTDREVHRCLKGMNIKNPGGEWFKCSVDKVKAAVLAVWSGEMNEEFRTLNFKIRPEQQKAVEKTAAYFKEVQKESPDKTPHFLWNAKMRFGKTFTAYQLAKKMGWCKVLVLTFKPAVEHAWEEDLKGHIDFTRAGSLSPPVACPMRKLIRKSRLSASGRSRIIWAETPAPRVSKPRTNGFTRPIGIA